MIEYNVETLIFDNGERYPILMGSDSMPHFHVTLWVTTKLRSVGKAERTISNKLNHIKRLLGWQKQEQRDLYTEFCQHKFLDEADIENIKAYLSTDIQKSNRIARSNSRNRNKVINITTRPSYIDVAPTVGRNHLYNRMTSAIEYINFLATLATTHNTTPLIKRTIKKMDKNFRSARPKGKGKNVRDRHDNKTIPDGLIDEFMEVAHFENPLNPFKKEEIRFRNHLMFHLLKKHGLRRGELLSLSISHITLHGSKKVIWVKRTHDDKFDPRKKQPVAKTKERMLRIGDKTAELLDIYITKYRANTPNAIKHPYLFVTHRKGSTQGQPISISTFDNTIVPTIKAVDERFEVIHPHYFRHNWNEDFSKKVDDNNTLADAGVKGFKRIDSGDEAKMRMAQMGHSSEKSGDIYNKRHITKKANEVSLADQEELQRKATEIRNTEEKTGEIEGN